MEGLKENPFAALFPSLQKAVEFTSENQNSIRNSLNAPEHVSSTDEADKNEAFAETLEIDSLIQNIFLITLNNEPNSSGRRDLQCVFLRDLHIENDVQNWLDLKLLDQAVFERLMLSKPSEYLICQDVNSKNKKKNIDCPAAQPNVMYYLFQSYKRRIVALQSHKVDLEDAFSRFKSVIVNNSKIALGHPEIFPNPQSPSKFLDFLIDYKEDSDLTSFMNDVVEAIEISHDTEDEPSVEQTFVPVLHLIVAKLSTSNLTDPRLFDCIQLLRVFQIRTSLADAFMSFITPKDLSTGKAYEKTLLGLILKWSTIPESEQGPYEYFENPLASIQREYENMEQILWISLKRISTEVHELLHTMLLRLSPTMKHKILTWIGNCLHENSGRAKLWHSHMSGLLNFNHASDGFMLNLTSVLLRFCRPFSSPSSSKLSLIDPTYCAATLESEAQSEIRGIHLKGLSQETCLISADDVSQRPQSESYKFATECFYMTHRCLQLGFRAMHERMIKLVTELRRLQRVYADAIQQNSGSPEVVENLKNAVERGTTMYLCTRTHMIEPETLEMMLSLHTATAAWLVQVATDCDPSCHPIQFQPVKFPLPDQVTSRLVCVPEFIIENVSDFMTFLLRFSPGTLEMAGDTLEHVMTMILVFMGNPERVRNPHLRAKLAEALDSIMPHPEEKSQGALGSLFRREHLFVNHPHIKYLAEVLLNVFVSIEMTGQSVAFEQKFNYRRPMYEVLAYIWKLEIHRTAIKKLARDAENRIDSAQPPLFLRFINLLINDAIYLLDEGLLHMSSLREHQQRRDTEEFQQMTPQQRQDSEANFRHTGMLARFHNVMGKQTINTLSFVTTEVVSIFVHPTMVERIAAMLNYFLLHLVGPKNRALKVRDMDEYEFKPQEIVTGICSIYINLGGSPAFWTAVATDGRSYSSELFIKAEEVLFKIGEGALVPEFCKVAANVKETAEKLKIREEALLEAPEEYLDPIMGTLMQDPVLLPSSKVVVDRSTIARHILSDQTDPFNRSPLTMEMVQPAQELRLQIEKWLEQTQLSKS